MTVTAFMSALLANQVPGAAGGGTWFDALRAAALERANSTSVPTIREEEWRFTDLAPLTRLSFQPVVGAALVDAAVALANAVPEASARLVFVDGMRAADLSQQPAVSGLRVLGLREALQTHPDIMQRQLARLAPAEASVFTALNTAFLRDATVLFVDAGRVIDAPVHILHLATSREQAHAVYPRTLVIAANDSRFTFIEDYIALDEASYFSAPVTEVSVGAGASISHLRLQREAGDAYHLGHCSVRQGASSRYALINIALGARLSRLDLRVSHDGDGCDSTIDDLAFIGRRQLADTHSSIDHVYPQGRLRQVYKCAVSDGAHAVFNGKIIVREGAQQTDAGQSCRALLLSERARVDAKPQLEIFADDVKCAHGAAIGQLDPEEMFYLRSRGLSEERARNLLTYAFAAEVIERIPVASLRTRLARTVLERTQETA